MNKLLDKYLREPYINVLCVELGINLNKYKSNRRISIIIGIVLGALSIFAGVVFKSIALIIVGIICAIVGYRIQYLRIKRLERITREKLLSIYPLFVQTFISLLYTNDNLIKVFLLLENYHYHPYIDRALIILINKYQANPENRELIFEEFCNIFDTTSTSLLHQLLVNISKYGINDSEIRLLEAKIDSECDKYFAQRIADDSKKLYQFGAIGVTSFISLLVIIVISII